jgi:transposase
MNSEQLFQAALSLHEPWQVKRVSFEPMLSGQQALIIQVGFPPGSRFQDEHGQFCSVYDTEVRSWQHLNFFEHRCTIECAVPRITDSTGKVVTVQVPWARANSGFTLMFEAFSMALIESEMPVSRVAKLLKVNPDRIWTVFNHWVGKALAADRCEELTRLAIDETSSKRGHKYVTVGVDLDNQRVVAVVEGKSGASVQAIATVLANKGAPASQVAEVSMDLSPAFIAGVSATFEAAMITFDRFHVVKLLNEAMANVHRMERAEHADLRGHKFTFVRNRANLSDKQEIALAGFIDAYPKLGEAYRLKTLFNELWSMTDVNAARAFVTDWCREVERAKIMPFMTFANTVRAHLTGIVRFVQTKITNGVLEGINSKIQLAKRRARGFRNVANFKNMIYFLCGKLNFDYPY